jgi:FtsP/CotA-like multicopper oxidase with cupredoxin domain
MTAARYRRFVHYARLVGANISSILWVTVLALMLATQVCFAQGRPAPSAARPGKDLCTRFAPGSTVTEPAELFSRNGVLRVNLRYNTSPDENGNPKYCFTTPGGEESPTLHVRPGDRLVVKIKNNLPRPAEANSMKMLISGPGVCGAREMNDASVNIHYHGTNTSPKCGQDEVIRTIVNPGQTFTYNLAFPTDEPPGLYWYHPHVHGLSEAAVQGGASGAIIVDGIESIQPAVIGLPQRLLLVRDQLTPCGDNCPEDAPAWDLSLNYIPITYPKYQTAVIRMNAGAREFWRVGNVSADTILDLQLV